MLQSVLNGTKRSSLAGNLSQCVSDCINSSCCIVAGQTCYIQTIHAKSSCTHLIDVQSNLVIAGRISTYMQAQVNSIIQVCEGLNLQIGNASVYISRNGLDIIAVITLDCRSHIVNVRECLNTAGIQLLHNFAYVQLGNGSTCSALHRSAGNELICAAASNCKGLYHISGIADCCSTLCKAHAWNSTCWLRNSTKLAGQCSICSTIGQFTNITAVVTFQQISLIELGRSRYTVNFCYQLVNFALDCISVALGLCAVCGLNCQLIHSLQHIMNFCQSAFCGLHCTDTILCVCRSLCKSSDLLSHLLGNSQACGIICCTVDPVAGRQLLSSLSLWCCGQAKHSVRVHSC